jgi:regulator of protease activity HflC (stomatin/prohibitin superfamily)
MVKEGSVAVTHDEGKLDVLRAGFHILTHHRHIFSHYLDMKDQFDLLPQLDLMTRDNVPIAVDCIVNWRLVDPDVAALRGGNMQALHALVVREAKACMASQVLQSTVSELDTLTDPSNEERNAQPGGGDEKSHSKSEKLYQGRVSSDNDRGRFLARAREALAQIGIRLVKMAVRKISILDRGINAKLATQASIRVSRMEKLDTANVESQTTDIKARARAAAAIAEAKGQGTQIKILADARLYEAQKIAEAAEILNQNDTARVLAELSSMAQVLKETNTNTIFVNGGGGRGGSALTNSILSNSNLVQANQQKQ